jgi:hypothetical protein
MRDPHQALKHEQLSKGRATIAGVDFFLVRSQWGKEDFGFSLHAAPNQFSTSEVQTTDFLASLGFERAKKKTRMETLGRPWKRVRAGRAEKP